MDIACLTFSPYKKAFIDLAMNHGSQSKMTLLGIPNLWKRLSIKSVIIPSVRATGHKTLGESSVILQIVVMVQLTSRRILRD